jgi:hypothetical protein
MLGTVTVRVMVLRVGSKLMASAAEGAGGDGADVDWRNVLRAVVIPAAWGALEAA